MARSNPQLFDAARACATTLGAPVSGRMVTFAGRGRAALGCCGAACVTVLATIPVRPSTTVAPVIVIIIRMASLSFGVTAAQA